MDEFNLEERTKNSPEEIADALVIMWASPSHDGKILLLVEYDDDKTLYFKFFDSNVVEIEPSCGCNKMRRIHAIIQMHDINMFSIQDSDFSRVCNCEPKEANYFLTDYHDHEMMCLSDESVRVSLFRNLAIEYDDSLVNETFEDLLLLSQMKWFNYSHHLNINFKGFKTQGVCSADLHSFDFIYSVVKPHSPKLKVNITEDELSGFIASQGEQDLFEITNGHDYLDLLSEKICRKYKLHNLSNSRVRSIIYTSFTTQLFSKTNLYKRIKNWASSNSYSIFVA